MNRQLSSTKAGAQCDRLETVVSRTKLTVLATVDRLFDRRPWRVYYTKRHAASVFAQGGWMRKRVARVHLQQLIPVVTATVKHPCTCRVYLIELHTLAVFDVVRVAGRTGAGLAASCKRRRAGSVSLRSSRRGQCLQVCRR